ncbi:nucleotidyltransferase domain-containing protein [Leifsonia sp. 2MCAF36]|uniref:nucleotidyltransferase domain-containing protein n=1 Tax=Leifsonia sp. 2MCAF36 TaxID=3232988 RepID=UPI003F9E20A6
MLDHDEVVRLYGPWAHRTPADAATRFGGYGGQWWIAGGWAIDAFVGSSREHGDLDIGIPRDSLDGFIRFFSPGLDVWAAAGSLTPLFPGSAPRLHEGTDNLWLRASGADPWEYDVMLERVQDSMWIFKRDPRILRPLKDCLWRYKGVTYLRPEVQLLLKAQNPRAKDENDFERCLPLLDLSDLDWLKGALHSAHPGHHWIERINRRLQD